MSDPASLTSKPIISVFGSSLVAVSTPAYQLAHELGAALAGAGFAVATGAYGGVMAAVSSGAAEAGGEVIGVVAVSLPGQANRWVQKKILVETWEQRLLKLIAIGNGYVACPGGTGTLAELAVVWEMLHKRLLPGRSLVALGNFWRPVIEYVGAVEPQNLRLIHLAPSVADAVRALAQGSSQNPV
ncbi:MAG: LOG family protein [Acidobacteria bacterium]|nr:LOG family protein [Acidobacteriota bacterium]